MTSLMQVTGGHHHGKRELTAAGFGEVPPVRDQLTLVELVEWDRSGLAVDKKEDLAFEIDGSTECCGALAEVAEQLLFLGSRIGGVPDVIMWVESLTLSPLSHARRSKRKVSFGRLDRAGRHDGDKARRDIQKLCLSTMLLA
jgi:hypothetical protein